MRRVETRARLGGTAWLLAALLSACAEEPTQLLVELCTDYSTSELGSLRVSAIDADDPAASEVIHTFENDALAAGALTFGVEGMEGRRVRLVARLLAPSGALLVERVVETSFVRGETTAVTLRLPRVCAGARCDDGTCGDVGLCEPVWIPPDAWPERASVCREGGPVVDCDADRDGARSLACGGDDCDDLDPNRFPGNVERCDTLDQDCDPCTVGVRDDDMDGVTSDLCSNPGARDTVCEGLVVEGDLASGADCDDTRAESRPGAEERCNGLDDDCDGRVDEGFDTTPFWIDADRDGFGDASSEPIEGCARPDGYAANADDCDDDSARRRPDAAEACDGVDDDCDGRIDELVDNVFYRDLDGDGFGVLEDVVALAECDPPDGYAAVAGDCAPDDPSVHPGAAELCNRRDDDCSSVTPGGVDESEDRDGDGHAPIDATCAPTTTPTHTPEPRSDAPDATTTAMETSTKKSTRNARAASAKRDVSSVDASRSA